LGCGAQGGGERVAEPHVPLRHRHQVLAAAPQRGDRLPMPREVGDGDAGIAAMAQPVAVAGLRAAPPHSNRGKFTTPSLPLGSRNRVMGLCFLHPGRIAGRQIAGISAGA
jgi:hypothetical protein